MAGRHAETEWSSRVTASPVGSRFSAPLSTWVQSQWLGPTPSAGARLLQPMAWLYAALANMHRAAYRIGLRRVQRAPVPLLVVGNLVAGGAGKTPAVMALIESLRRQGWTPGVISRGHGRRKRSVQAVSRFSTATEVGDEPLLIHLRSGAAVVVGADRSAAALALCAAHPEVDLLLADDGLQHHRLHHDMAIWVFDDRGAGNKLGLPAGPLRQAVPKTLPPHTLVLYNAAKASTALPGLCGARRLGRLLPLSDWWQGLQQEDSDAGNWEALRGRRVLAAAGLARPEAFFGMLEAQGLRIDRLPLPDHHGFDPLPWPAGTADLIVTEKDAVKLPPAAVGNTRVWVATLDFQPEPAFDAALRALCAPFKPPHEP